VNRQAARKRSPGNLPLFRIMVENRFSEPAPVKIARTNEEDALIRTAGRGEMLVHRSERVFGFFSVPIRLLRTLLRRRHISRKSRGPATPEFLIVPNPFAYFVECP